jgi:hypothetical protein
MMSVAGTSTCRRRRVSGSLRASGAAKCRVVTGKPKQVLEERIELLLIRSNRAKHTPQCEVNLIRFFLLARLSAERNVVSDAGQPSADHASAFLHSLGGKRSSASADDPLVRNSARLLQGGDLCILIKGEMEPIARVNFATAMILIARVTANQADHR